MRAGLVGPVALPRHVVAEEVELADAARDEVAGDGVDEQVAEAVAGERGVEAGLEQVVGVAVDERVVEGDAALAGAQEVAGELAARGEGVGEGAVAAAAGARRRRWRCRRRPSSRRPRGRSLRRGGVELDGGQVGAVDALEGERADLGLELLGATAQVAAELASPAACRGRRRRAAAAGRARPSRPTRRSAGRRRWRRRRARARRRRR